MKKLMIAAAIVCVAAFAEASQYNWAQNGSPMGALYAGSTATLYSKAGGVTLYLFDAAEVSQKELYDSLVAGGNITDYTAATTTTLASNSKPTAKAFDYGTVNEKYDLYFATVFNDGTKDLFYISSLKADQACPESGTTTISWSDLGSNSKSIKTAYAAAGGVYAVDVPEPTSGLLLLLGMAGLALRRRRA